MQFTKNLSPEESFTLHYFLLTCIQYISDFQPLADHKLSSLAKLADVTHIPKELGYDDSAFDRIMSEKTRTYPDGQHSEFKAYYNIYKSRSKKNVKGLLKKQVSTIRKNYTPYGINKKSR
jgi:hypothetical protein